MCERGQVPNQGRRVGREEGKQEESSREAKIQGSGSQNRKKKQQEITTALDRGRSARKAPLGGARSRATEHTAKARNATTSQGVSAEGRGRSANRAGSGACSAAIHGRTPSSSRVGRWACRAIRSSITHDYGPPPSTPSSAPSLRSPDRTPQPCTLGLPDRGARAGRSRGRGFTSFRGSPRREAHL
jgi:hypothetical protein